MKANAKLSMISLNGGDYCFNLDEDSRAMTEAKTIALRYKHGKATGACTSRIVGDPSLFCLPNLLQSQTRIRHSVKPTLASSQRIPFKTELHQSPFTVTSYRSDVNNSKAISFEERTSMKPNHFNKSRSIKHGINGPAKWKSKPSSLSNQSTHPDPMIDASKKFLNRISELSLLQLETIKLENSKRKTKKSQTVQKTTF